GYYAIDKEKPALLGKVHGFGELENDEEADMGIYSIAGVKQYETVMALVLYSAEHGDGSHQELAAYHPRGELVDHINMGYWSDWNGCNIDDDPASDISIITNSFLTFTDDGFDLHVVDEVYDINDHERLAENRKGSAVKVVHYAYDGMNGFKLQGIDFSHEGLFVADHYAHDDIRDLRYWPLSDTNVFDRINELAALHDATREVPDDCFDDLDDKLQIAVSDMLWGRTKAFMQWLYWHRNDENNHLKYIVTMNFVSGRDDIESVLAVLNTPDVAKVREYVSHLLDGWNN
ncbi:MAG: hypothetical protein IKX39_05745, partial [Muribaculaceae bacterium]|nr:hypothetical protein [Muribaculaceae bacterium]